MGWGYIFAHEKQVEKFIETSTARCRIEGGEGDEASGQGQACCSVEGSGQRGEFRLELYAELGPEGAGAGGTVCLGF